MNQLTISKLLFKYILIKKCLLHRELYQKNIDLNNILKLQIAKTKCEWSFKEY